MLKILAAFVLVTATKRQGSKSPAWTPFSHTRDIRSSTPLTPFGILVKSPLPKALCSLLKVQLSLPVSCRSSLSGELEERVSTGQWDYWEVSQPKRNETNEQSPLGWGMQQKCLMLQYLLLQFDARGIKVTFHRYFN